LEHALEVVPLKRVPRIDERNNCMDTLRKRTISLIIGVTMMAGLGILAGCHGKESTSATSPSLTPPEIMKSAQQNADARSVWLRTHLDSHGSPIPQAR